MFSAGLALLLAAAPADVARCKQALAKVTTQEAPERIDAFQACGPLLGDLSLRTAWLGVVHTSPFDAAPILALAVGEPVPGATPTPNACARTHSELPICGPDRGEVGRLTGPERSAQWKRLFFRVLDTDFPPAQAAALSKAFAEKWAALFPDAPPPRVATDGPLKVSGNINRLEVLRGLGAVRPELDKCLASRTDALWLKWTVDAQGKVGAFAVLAPGEPARVACITKAFKTAVMPPAEAGGTAILVWTPEPPGSDSR